MECRHKFTMCRLCLCENECFFDIFQVNEWFGGVAAEVIRDLLQFQVSELDGLPHVVCSICLGKLMDFNQFKVQCQNSRDTYNNVFASDESHAEHPIDIVPSEFIKTELEERTVDVDASTEEELRLVKLEPQGPLDTQESQQEIRKCSAAFPPPEYLARCRKGTHSESYGPYDGKPSSKSWEKAAADADRGKNDESSGSARVKVGKMDVKARTGRESPGERIRTLPAEESDANRAETSAEESRRETTKRREDATRVDVAPGDERTSKSDLESDGGAEGGSERREEAPLGANEREGKRERFRCGECVKDFEEKDVLIRHLELHGYEVRNNDSSGEERDVQVRTDVNCGSKRDTNEVRKIGLNRKTSGKVKVRRYLCDSCGKGFDRKSHMKRHFRVHSGEKPFACTVCGKRFSDKSHLKVHELTHTGEKPYVCRICRKGFTQNIHLVSHGRTHSGEKPHACATCGKAFAAKTDLVKHGRVHSGERPYECRTCGKKFAQSGNLANHVHVHSGYKPYPCKVCEKRFSDRSTLRRHLRIHSREKP